MTTLLATVTSLSTVPGPAPWMTPVLTMPQPCGLSVSSSGVEATFIGPTTLSETRPAAPKNAMPASAKVSPDVTVTPEMSTNISLVSVEPSDWRETVMTLPPPSRR